MGQALGANGLTLSLGGGRGVRRWRGPPPLRLAMPFGLRQTRSVLWLRCPLFRQRIQLLLDAVKPAA